MKKIILTCATTGILLATPVMAEVSASAALSTEYIWRGATQTSDDMAYSGGVDYSNDNGAYAGVWPSNVDFGDADIEVDVYGGYSAAINDDLSWDVGFISYNYPGAKGRFDELYVGLAYGAYSITYYDDIDLRADGSIGSYVEAGADFEVGDYGVSLHLGNYDFEQGYSVVDYRVAFSTEIEGFGVELAVSDSDAEKTATDVTLTVSMGF